MLLWARRASGKSRLASEIAPIVREQWPDAAVLSGRCVPYGEANPWWPIADALRNGLGLELDDAARRGAPDGHRRLTSTVARRGVDQPAIVNGLLHLMGYEGPLRGLDPTRARAEATQALLSYLEAVVRTVRSSSASPTSTGPTTWCSS